MYTHATHACVHTHHIRTHTFQDVGEREEIQREEIQREEREGERHIYKEQRDRETHIYTLVTRQIDSERDKSRKTDGGTEDIKMETPKRQTKKGRRKEMQGEKGREEGKIGKK